MITPELERVIKPSHALVQVTRKSHVGAVPCRKETERHVCEGTVSPAPCTYIRGVELQVVDRAHDQFVPFVTGAGHGHQPATVHPVIGIT